MEGRGVRGEEKRASPRIQTTHTHTQAHTPPTHLGALDSLRVQKAWLRTARVVLWLVGGGSVGGCVDGWMDGWMRGWWLGAWVGGRWVVASEDKTHREVAAIGPEVTGLPKHDSSVLVTIPPRRSILDREVAMRAAGAHAHDTGGWRVGVWDNDMSVEWEREREREREVW